MPGCIGLFDRDVFLKLACCDLWGDALGCLGVTQAFRLASTNSERSNEKLVRRMLRDAGAEVASTLARVRTMVASTPVMPGEMAEDAERSSLISRLVRVSDIDQGEAVLAAVFLRETGNRVLVTGDKRFVAAFRGELPEDFQRTRAGIFSFERCLAAIVERHGAEHVLRRVRPVAACDGTLRLAIGHGGSAGPDAFLDALRSMDPCR